MNRSLLVLAVLSFAASPSAGASAQEPEPEDPRAMEVESADESELAAQLEYARYLNDVGMGLTLGGIATTGVGTGAMFGGGWAAGLIAGGFFTGVGSVLALAGIPMWIVGSVRSNILSASEVDRTRIAWDYELAGMVTALLGIGISVVGMGLMLGTFAAVRSGALPSDGARTHETLIGTGGVMIPIGVFVGLFIGTPMWAEGARF